MTSVAVGQVEIDDRGVAFVGRTRMKVSQIVAERKAWGLTPEQIAANHETITLSEVYTALAWYADHREAIDNELASTNEFAAESREQSGQPTDLKEQLKQRRRPDS
jgi:uncharacterized protein (DUF433 family)